MRTLPFSRIDNYKSLSDKGKEDEKIYQKMLLS